MRSISIFRLFLATAVGIAVTNSVVVIGLAQEAAQPPSQAEDFSRSDELPWSDLLQATITIDQSPGTVKDFIQILRESSPQLNIVVTENAAEYPLPEIKLVKVPVRGAISLLSTLSDNAVEVSYQSQEEGHDANLILISSQVGAPFNRESTTVRVLNVKYLLQASNREALLSALDEGYRLLDNQQAPVELKIHEATGLLFVKGTPEQLMLAESVVEQIARGLGPEINDDPYGQPEKPLPTLRSNTAPSPK